MIENFIHNQTQTGFKVLRREIQIEKRRYRILGEKVICNKKIVCNKIYRFYMVKLVGAICISMGKCIWLMMIIKL